MIILELNEALLNINTEDDYEQSIVFRELYRIICSKGILCFDKEGKANGIDGEVIICRVIEYYADRGRQEKCWWLRRNLLLYQNRFRGYEEREDKPGSAEFVYLPSPTRGMGL